MSNRANELAEQKLRDRIKSFIHDVLKSADDVVVSTNVIISVQSQEELYGHLKTRYHEYERRSEPQFKKQIAWHLNKLYAEVTVSCSSIYKKPSQATCRSSSLSERTSCQAKAPRRRLSKSSSRHSERRRQESATV